MIKQIKIVAIDDNTFFLKAFNSLLLKDSSLDVLNVYTSGINFLKSNDLDKVDILLLDIEMPEMNGFEIAKRVMDIRQDVKIIAVSMKHHHLYIQEFIEYGFAGYIYKPDIAKDYQKVIANVKNGEKCFPSTDIE